MQKFKPFLIHSVKPDIYVYIRNRKQLNLVKNCCYTPNFTKVRSWNEISNELK